MNDILRYITAAVLIFLIIALQPLYLDWLGYNVADDSLDEISNLNLETKQVEISLSSKEKFPVNSKTELATYKVNSAETFTTIVTPLFTTTITSRSGGSFLNYYLTSEKEGQFDYVGSYEKNSQLFNPLDPVSLILDNTNNCNPCLSQYNSSDYEYIYFNQNFNLLTDMGKNDTIYVETGSIKLDYSLTDVSGNTLINKSVIFYSDSYFNEHFYEINDEILFSTNSNNIELTWLGGLRPTEEKQDEDIMYGSAIINQAGEIEELQSKDSEEALPREIYNGQTDWVAIRTKYFISAIISESPGKYAMLSSNNILFGKRDHTPAFNASIGYHKTTNKIEASIYLGPLDIDKLSHSNADLDAAMNWGYAPIKPISKGILWLLKFMHNKLNLNYGLVLLLFAVLVHLITRPLTKKSYESSQNMQKIQPLIKKIQAKHKSDPTKLNKETMALYKKHSVNPLGGCLPIMLQMPLLWALFIVFRTTIEFRGAPFMLWINDLSKPDIVINLPFTIPVYGNGIAILPLIMGATLMMTMRMSSATMDSSQKPVMYFMNGFFILIFNSFPSGLNLYYTTYNILSFFQQRKIRKNVADK